MRDSLFRSRWRVPRGAGLALAAFAASIGVAAGPVLDLSRTDVSFGRTPQGYTTPVQPVWLANVGDAPLAVASLALTGAYASEFALAGTCVAPLVLQPGERCRTDTTLTPAGKLPALRAATLSIVTNAGVDPATVTLSATIDNGAPQSPFQGVPIDPSPDWLDFGAQPVGSTGASQIVNVVNTGNLTFSIATFALSGGDAADFALATGCVLGSSLAPGQGCPATIAFSPSAVGPRSTELETTLTYLGVPGSYRVSVTGVGAASAPAAKISAVEYYNAQIGHYFLTAQADEQFGLDTGVFPGWVRTGNGFNAWDAPAGAALPVFRLFTVKFASKAAHFYTASAAERDYRRVENGGDWTYEKVAYYLPESVGGACAAGAVPVYRMFNNGQTGAPNHRFTTSPAIYQDFTTNRGWAGEGIVFCAPA